MRRDVVNSRDLDAAAYRSSARSPTDRSGERYRLGRVLGSGGGGVVREAYDLWLGRTVALKRVRARKARWEAILHEARMAARLAHPGIVQIHDIVLDEEGPLLVLEHVMGEDLAQRIERGPMPPAAIGDIGIQLACALAHAHDHGVLHCDVKPGNVLLTPGGVAKLTDFGLGARGSRVRPPGGPRGTPDYAAPELERSGVVIDGRVDVYGLGMTLAALAFGPRPDRSEFCRLPPPLGGILRRATDPRPEGRQASANELARELSNPGEAFRNRTGGDQFRICITCRRPVVARDYFCVHCGTELGPACKACGYDEVPSGDHCPLCGADFLRYPVHRAFLEAIRRRLFEGIEPFPKDDSS